LKTYIKAAFSNIKGLIENKRAIADIKSHSTITIDSIKTASSAQASELEDVAATDIEASSMIFVATLSICLSHSITNKQPEIRTTTRLTRY
jgi:hypothetical protein